MPIPPNAPPPPLHSWIWLINKGPVVTNLFLILWKWVILCSLLKFYVRHTQWWVTHPRLLCIDWGGNWNLIRPAQRQTIEKMIQKWPTVHTFCEVKGDLLLFLSSSKAYVFCRSDLDEKNDTIFELLPLVELVANFFLKFASFRVFLYGRIFWGWIFGMS